MIIVYYLDMFDDIYAKKIYVCIFMYLSIHELNKYTNVQTHPDTCTFDHSSFDIQDISI